MLDYSKDFLIVGNVFRSVTGFAKGDLAKQRNNKMTDLLQLFITCNDFNQPPQVREQACRQFQDFFRELFASVELARFLRPRIPPIPLPVPATDLEVDAIHEKLANHEFLIRELLMHALGVPVQQLGVLTYLSEKNTHQVTARELLERFEVAAEEMRQIVNGLDNK